MSKLDDLKNDVHSTSRLISGSIQALTFLSEGLESGSVLPHVLLDLVRDKLEDADKRLDAVFGQLQEMSKE